jgi:hypothetical protein
MPRLGTNGTTDATTGWQRIPAPQAQHTDPDKVSRVVRKSPVDGRDMQRFFGTYLRPKAFIDLPPKICKEGPAVKPRSVVGSDDLGLPHEIIEAILSHLPIFDLIVATGINMTFRTIVQNSPMLQRKLFLRPAKQPMLYVQVEHPDYGCRTRVAEESGVDVDVDEHDDGELYASDDSEEDSEWQWSGEHAVVDLCPFLLRNFHGYHNRSVRERVLYKGGEKVHFSKLAALAEHWANMYLTNPPCTEVIAHMSYYNGIAGGDGSIEGVRILADRTVYCENGVTVASLFDVLNMEGNVKITETDSRLGRRLGDDLVGLQKNTTISREIEDLTDCGGLWPDKTQLDRVGTVIEFPGVVFQEWRTVSGDYYVRSGEKVLSYRECQVTAEEEALHG